MNLIIKKIPLYEIDFLNVKKVGLFITMRITYLNYLISSTYTYLSKFN